MRFKLCNIYVMCRCGGCGTQMCREKLIDATEAITERLGLQEDKCCVILSAGEDTCALMETVTHLNSRGKGPKVSINPIQ